jgi:hypothetical protein
MLAAAAWAGRPGDEGLVVDTAVISSLEAAGAPAEVLAAARKNIAASAEFEVWPENWESFLFFTGLETQWRFIAGLSGTVRTGLDYTAVLAEMQLKGMSVPDRIGLFADIKLMERAALEALNKT